MLQMGCLQAKTNYEFSLKQNKSWNPHMRNIEAMDRQNRQREAKYPLILANVFYLQSHFKLPKIHQCKQESLLFNIKIALFQAEKSQIQAMASKSMTKRIFQRYIFLHGDSRNIEFEREEEGEKSGHHCGKVPVPLRERIKYVVAHFFRCCLP